MGACKAAIHERIKFINIKGKGSNAVFFATAPLKKIQRAKMIPNKIINFQLPPNKATLSESFCPADKISFTGC
jgi:hypothetical protein